MEQRQTRQEGASDTTPERFQAGIEDAAILPLVALALIVKKVLRAAWTGLIYLIDFLFPILLQLMRFPLFTLRILGDAGAALLQGIGRILPIGGMRRAAWREFVARHWAWLRQKISYKAFEEAVHHAFESGMAWVFRTCKALTPGAALLVIAGALLWIPISFGAATFLHALLLAKATSLPPWMQLLHAVATIVAKSKLLVLPVYPAAWPQAKQHPWLQAVIGYWRHFTTLYFVRKTRHRFDELEGAFDRAGQASRAMAASLGVRLLIGRMLAALDTAAAAIGRGVRNTAAKSVAALAAVPLLGAIVRRYADHYDEAARLPAAPLSDRARAFWARWSIKFTAEYYEPKERGETKPPPARLS